MPLAATLTMLAELGNESGSSQDLEPAKPQLAGWLKHKRTFCSVVYYVKNQFCFFPRIVALITYKALVSSESNRKALAVLRRSL